MKLIVARDPKGGIGYNNKLSGVGLMEICQD